MKNDVLLEQFVVWQCSVYKYGLNEHQLNEVLPIFTEIDLDDV